MGDEPPREGAGRPWWSSGAPPPPGDGPERTRRTRPGYEDLFEQVAGGEHHHDGEDHDGGDDHEHDAGGIHVDACQVCPICAVLRMAGEVRPELLVHLSEAARHLTLAAKTIVDAQASGFGGRGLEHIPLDDDPPGAPPDTEAP